MPVNVQDEKFCHDQRIEWLKKIDSMKPLHWMKPLDRKK